MKKKESLEKSELDFQENKKFFAKLKKKNSRELDTLFHQEHDRVFKKTDCLTCANCCKTTSPIFRDIDIKRISKKIKLSENQFISKFLKIDEDKDYVLKQSPCTFLDEKNYCTIYEDRPLACREYPHTNRKNMYQILDLTHKNTLICPAVVEIVEKIKQK